MIVNASYFTLMDGHEYFSRDEVIVKLKALRAKYRETELLMTKNENVDEVRNKLHQINSDFDHLMCLCTFVNEDETMPGSTSLKIDVIKVKDDFKQKVESWLARVELPGVPAENESYLCESANVRPNMPVDVHEACMMVNADGAMSVRDKPPDMVPS